MRVKYFLHIGGKDHVLRDDDIRNWDDIIFSYKRDNLGGIVRTFTSKFDFVNRAYRLLRELFIADGIGSDASVIAFVMDGSWRFERLFECRLDFSSLSWEEGIVTVSGIDDSLAAKIKANKGTKYEFVIGSDIIPDSKLYYDRLIMSESLTYEVSGGTSDTETGGIYATWEKGKRLWIGNVGSEIAAGAVIRWNEDQTEDSYSYLFKAMKAVSVNLSYLISHRRDYGSGSIGLYCRVTRSGSVVKSCHMGGAGADPSLKFEGTFTTPDQLQNLYPEPSAGQWALVNGTVWASLPIHTGYSWHDTKLTRAEYFTTTSRGDDTLDLQAGDIVSIDCETASAHNTVSVMFAKTEFKFEWSGRGEGFDIDAFSPEVVGNAILNKMAGDDKQYDVEISRHDRRMARTRVIAAESVRGLAKARIYSSFNEFCDWMETTFGYVYYVGEVREDRFTRLLKAGEVVGTPYPVNQFPSGVSEADTDRIVYLSSKAAFAYRDTDGLFYAYWPGWEDYNDYTTGLARTDTVFNMALHGVVGDYYFNTDGDGLTEPIRFILDTAKIGLKCQTVHFVHRSEIFTEGEAVQNGMDVSDVEYTVDSSRVYSSVTIGYKKKDYDSPNGRDEFNFSNTYSTGCDLTDKKLSLISGYRADGYGVEFAALKRSEETTDTDSDNDVFFMLCANEGDKLIPDRTAEIVNGYSDSLINGAFSPMACVKANADIIGMQLGGLPLSFASSDGNSDIVIDGEPMASDITLGASRFTCGKLKFTTDFIQLPSDLNAAVSVEHDGVKYTGYISGLELNCAKEESAKYELIVKSIEL